MSKYFLGLFFLFFLPFFFFSAGISFAADHYVSPTGSATWVNSTSINAPCSIQTMFSGVRSTDLGPGEYIYLRGGTYSLSSSLITSRSISQDGTVSAPIYLKAYPGETPLIAGDGLEYLILIQNQYWFIDGINFYASNMPTAGGGGSACVKVGGDGIASHSLIKNCKMTVASVVGTDNSAAICLHSASEEQTVENNILIGPGHHAAGVQYLGSGKKGTKILNNDISGFSYGVYIKHQNTDTDLSSGAEIAYNYLHDNQSGLWGVSEYIYIHDNIITTDGSITDPPGGINFGDNGGGGSGGHNIIDHNTILRGAFGLQIQDETGNQYNTSTHNINTLVSQWNSYRLVDPHLTADYNLYISGSGAIRYLGTLYSLPGWSVYSGQDLHSVSAAPTFVGGPSPNTVAGFALTSSSRGSHLVDVTNDGRDMGADVSLVGIRSSQDTIPPAAPIGLFVS